MGIFRFSAKRGSGVLGPLESDVMEIVWSESAPVSVTAVHAILGRKKKLAYSTVKAVLSNLADKGHLRKKSEGRSNVFVAVRTRDEFRERVVSDVLGSLVRDYRNPLLAHLVERVATDAESLDELERLVASRRRDLGRHE